MADLADLFQKKAFYDAGGRDPGTTPTDRFMQQAGNVASLGSTYESIIKQVLDNKKLELENKAKTQATTPIVETLGNPRMQSTLGAAQNDVPQPQGGFQDWDQFQNAVIGQRQGGIDTATQQITQLQNKYGQMTPDEYSKISAGGLKDAQTEQILKGGDSLPVSALPKEPQKRALAAGYKLGDMIDIKKFNALKTSDPSAMVPMMTTQAGLAAGEVPGNARVVTPQQLNPYANIKEKIAAANSLPSQMGQTSVPGSASQVLQRVQKAQTLIAAPLTSPQRLSLVATDIAGALQQGAPQMDSIKGAGFSDNLITYISKLKQKILSQPEGMDLPEIRKELYEIAADLKQSVMPSIEHQLQFTEAFYPDQLPANWPQLRANELGDNTPTPSFNGGGMKAPAQATAAPVQPGKYDADLGNFKSATAAQNYLVNSKKLDPASAKQAVDEYLSRHK